MIILHVSACDGRLALWGEKPEGSAVGQRGRRKARGGLAPSRFALHEGGIEWAAARAGLEPGFTAAQYDRYIAWLPTNKDGALPSSGLLCDGAVDFTDPTIVPWETPVVALTSDQAQALLLAGMAGLTLAQGVVVGKTLGYWSSVYRFAGELVARQAYVPALDTLDGEYRACWTPVLTGSSRQKAAELARAMPQACRALGQNPDAPPDASASDVLKNALATMVDHLVRTAAAPRNGDQKGRGGLHDQWLRALRSADGRMKGDASELMRLAEEANRWRRPIEVAATAPVRLCLRLEEPGPKRDDWNVTYWLQAHDDMSLIVPTAAAWKTEGPEAAVLAKNGFRPREYVLSALGQAAALCPRIEASLEASIPVGYTLDASGAHQFLAARAALLEQAGFGVFLPKWWTHGGTRLGLSAKAQIEPRKSNRTHAKSIMGLDQILQFQWKIMLGDHEISIRELENLAQLKAPLVKIRGQWVLVNPVDVAAALEMRKSKIKAAITGREAVRLALGAARPPGSIEFGGVEAKGWFGDLFKQLEGNAAFDPLDAPEGFQGVLRPYQIRGYSWLDFLGRWGFGACLADDMGLGKTIQTLALIQREWETLPARERRPSLLVCPISVVGNWSKEAARFTPDLPVMIHHGGDRARGADFVKRAAKHAVVVSSYSLLHRDFDLLAKPQWAAVVLDEAQNIKNPHTKQARAARGLEAKRKVALTGTPVENHVGDLWSIIEFLNPGWLGGHAEFKRNFQVPIQAQRDPEAIERLKRLTAPFVLRRLKSDKSIIDDLPEKLEMKVYCHLTKEQASLYAAVVKETRERIESTAGIERKGIVLSTITRLKQVCNHPAHFLGDLSATGERSAKVTRLTEMLEEILEVGDRALVFTQFAAMGTRLKEHFQDVFGREVLFLHGGTPKAHRDQMVERFQSPSAAAPPIFLLSLKAGGSGLNLTAASHVFHFDRWWNPAVEDQATDRAFRIGQTRRVQVHKFVCIGTLEERIDAMIQKKQEIAGAVVGGGESWLARMSNAELRDLFELRAEAVTD